MTTMQVFYTGYLLLILMNINIKSLTNSDNIVSYFLFVFYLNKQTKTLIQ